MTITEIAPGYAVSSQIAPEDVAALAALGYRSIMCNRPDGEVPGQPRVAAVRSEADRRGLAFAFVPVVSGAIDAEDVADFRAAVARLPQPVLAYCRSGTRCQNLWLLAQR